MRGDGGGSQPLMPNKAKSGSVVASCPRPKMGRKEIVYALTVRVLVAVLTQTFFQPDEYFQSLEPAHHFVFGYGALTWEWLNPLPIRSFIYPALNVPIYWFLKVTGVHQIPFWGDLFVVGISRILRCYRAHTETG